MPATKNLMNSHNNYHIIPSTAYLLKLYTNITAFNQQSTQYLAQHFIQHILQQQLITTNQPLTHKELGIMLIDSGTSMN